MICRRKNDPEQTLLCDACNKGWHMFCLKPKLTQIPQGDWFCPRCRPDDYKPKTQRARRKEFVEEVVELEEEITADDESTADRLVEQAIQFHHKPIYLLLLNSVSESEDEICMVCQFDGEVITCVNCDMQCHPECAKPPVKNTRVKNWKCWKCTSVQQRSDRIKRRRMDKGGR